MVECATCGHARHHHEQGEECNVAVVRGTYRRALYESDGDTTFCPCESFAWPKEEAVEAVEALLALSAGHTPNFYVCYCGRCGVRMPDLRIDGTTATACPVPGCPGGKLIVHTVPGHIAIEREVF
jgi:hypothetical protein